MKLTTLLAGALAAVAVAAPAPEAQPEAATTALEERDNRFSQAGQLNNLRFRNDDLRYLFGINNNVFGNFQLFQSLALEQQFNALAFSPLFNSNTFNIQSLLGLQVMHTLFSLFASGVVQVSAVNFAAFTPSVLNLGLINGQQFSNFDLATLIEVSNRPQIQGVLQTVGNPVII